MVGTGKILKAAIYGHDGSLWATTAGFNVSEKLKTPGSLRLGLFH